MTNADSGNGPGRDNSFGSWPANDLPGSPDCRTVFGARVFRLVRKELREILRDRRTILTLVLMPLLVYPLLAVVFEQHFLASHVTAHESATVGFLSEHDYRAFAAHIKLGTGVLARQDPRAEDEPNYKAVVSKSKDLKKDVKEGMIDLGIRIKREGNVGQDHLVVLEFIYKTDSRAAQQMVDYLEQRMAAATRGYLETRLGVPKAPGVRLAWAEHTHVPTPAKPRISLAALIPLILILMTITGAVYPAIDLTAGERERGTLEILVAAPVPRMGLLFAKYVSVFTVAVFTALINLGMMLVTLKVSGLGTALLQQQGISLLLIAQILGLLLLFAAFFSAALLTITSFARSFKEAQAYLIPVILLALAPGIVGILPGLKLESWLCVAPLVNIVLLARDLVEQTADPIMAVVVVGSTLLYAFAALAVAARIFGAEAVLYTEQSPWSDLWRRPEEPRDVPSLGSAMLCLALMFPAWFVLQGIRGELARFSVLWAFVWLAILSVLLFAGFPLASAFMTRVRLRQGFRLGPAPVTAFVGSIILGLSLWPIVLQVLEHLMHPELNLDPKMLQSMRDARANYPAALMSAMVVFAVVEEFFFRGYLFSALRARRGPGATILFSALCFGFFHMLTTQLFPFPRFLSSTLMGLVLGWVAWQSGSVLPGMLLHTIHNVILERMGGSDLATPSDLDWLWELVGIPGPGPLFWVLAGAGGVALGAGLVFLGRKVPPGKSGDVAFQEAGHENGEALK
jgi:ABC-2 type transport system permease protein/sodium transport system permease protein